MFYFLAEYVQDGFDDGDAVALGQQSPDEGTGDAWHG
jgi:hypothetical protein